MHNFVVHSNESVCRKSGRLGMEQVNSYIHWILILPIVQYWEMAGLNKGDQGNDWYFDINFLYAQHNRNQKKAYKISDDAAVGDPYNPKTQIFFSCKLTCCGVYWIVMLYIYLQCYMYHIFCQLIIFVSSLWLSSLLIIVLLNKKMPHCYLWF